MSIFFLPALSTFVCLFFFVLFSVSPIRSQEGSSRLLEWMVGIKLAVNAIYSSA